MMSSEHRGFPSKVKISKHQLTSVDPCVVGLLPGHLGSSPHVVLLVGVVDGVTDGVPSTLVHGLVTSGEGSGSEANVSGGLVSLLVVPNGVCEMGC